MPLYLDDFEPPSTMPQVFLQALVDLADAIGLDPVNPATATQLLRAHVMPLVPEAHRTLFVQRAQPSWDRLHVLYANLACASQGADAELAAAAAVVRIVVRHTTRPARDLAFAPSLEIASFERALGYLGLPKRRPSMSSQPQGLTLYDFCRYCWLPCHPHGVCAHHSSQPLPTRTGDPLCASLSRKQAQRMRPAFEAQALQLVSTEDWQFHESDFASSILLPLSGLAGWLTQRRPLLASLLSEELAATPRQALPALLRLLYGSSASEVGRSVADAVHLLTPVTTRAEAWVSAWRGRPSWGGRRAGAGNRSPARPAARG